ncbi:uncharacterized protein LOC105695350 [Orussus abietinus]|uniref:uncharacterized protein LOC105695350 n=1 Tax=Orussus abietinus TaxID=222816 RepID=UPI000626E1E3|nr:uncharacterized protein LOC105695350 [Orussus abietinus]
MSDAMPSAAERRAYLEAVPKTERNSYEREVELMVAQVTEKLRLKAKSSASQQSRPSPYQRLGASKVPTSSEKRMCRLIYAPEPERHRAEHRRKGRVEEEDDPYEVLRELLRKGALIKEAAMRVLNDFDEEQEDSEGEVRIDLTPVYRRKRNFNEPEEEPLTSVFQTLKL